MNRSEDDPILSYMKTWYAENLLNGLLQIRSRLRFLQDELEDVVQECIYYIYKRHKKGKTVESQKDFDRLMKWCIRMRSKNKLNSPWWRFENLNPSNESETNEESPSEAAHLSELKADLRDCVGRLPNVIRDIFKAFLNGTSYKEITERFAVQYNVATSQVSRGRQRIIRCMTKDKGHGFGDLYGF